MAKSKPKKAAHTSKRRSRRKSEKTKTHKTPSEPDKPGNAQQQSLQQQQPSLSHTNNLSHANEPVHQPGHGHLARSKGFFKKIQELTVTPAKFFEEVRHEAHIESRKHFGILLGIFVAAALITAFVTGRGFVETSDILPIIGWYFLFALIGFGLVLMYIGVLHVFVMVFERKKEFRQTAKLALYSTTPLILLGWIPKLSPFAFAYSAVLQVIGLSKVHGIALIKSVIIAVVAMLLVLAAIMVYIQLVLPSGV